MSSSHTCRRRKPLDREGGDRANGTESSNSRCEEEELLPISVTSAASHHLWPLTLFHPSHVLFDSEFYWNAGAFAPASILLELSNSPVYVTRISLVPVMLPAMGKVRHEIRLGLDPQTLRNACWYNGVCVDGGWIHIQLEENGELRRRSRYLEVMTHESPSWVAWRRIKVWKAIV